jgi:hypothetical protein
VNIMYTEDSGNATPLVSHCDHNKIKAAAVTKLSIPSEIRYNQYDFIRVISFISIIFSLTVR